MSEIDGIVSCSASAAASTPQWLVDGGFIPVILGIIGMFWGLAFICEEYCVAAITVFCKRNNISDDLAGAIFIGTGLSLPVLFVAFVGLFVSNSAIGVGAVVGGNAFNHLITIGSSVLVSPNRTMKLDAVIFTREMAAYFLSCLLLIWSIQGGDVGRALEKSLSSEQWLSCLSIPWESSLVLICAYIFYCIFDAYFYIIHNMINKYAKKTTILPISPTDNNHTADTTGAAISHTTEGVYIQALSTEVDNNVVIGSTTIADPSLSIYHTTGGTATRNNKKTTKYNTDNYDSYSDLYNDEDGDGCDINEYSTDRSNNSNNNSNIATTISRRTSSVDKSNIDLSVLKDKKYHHLLHGNNNNNKRIKDNDSDNSEENNDEYNENSQNIQDSTEIDLELGDIYSHPDHLDRLTTGQSLGMDVINNNRPNSVDLSDFVLLLKDNFYSRNDFGCVPSSRKWKLRYFSLDEHGLHYRNENHLPKIGAHVRYIDIFDLDSIHILDANIFEFCIKLRANNKRFVFKALDQTTFAAVIRKLRQFIEQWKVRTDGERTAMRLKSMFEVSNGHDSSLVHPDSEAVSDDMFTPPANNMNNILLLCLFYLVLPMKYLIYLTVPDVRKAGNENKAMLCVIVCIGWLAIQSYILTVGLTLIGDWWGISSNIMGITVAAWAANYPAHWSSIVVAREGYGDVASCNVFGSNVFNNFIGLGLPWILYSTVNGGKSYDALQDEGVVLSIILLMVLIVVHYAIVAACGFSLKFWQFPFLAIIYFLYIAYLCYFSTTQA